MPLIKVIIMSVIWKGTATVLIKALRTSSLTRWRLGFPHLVYSEDLGRLTWHMPRARAQCHQCSLAKERRWHFFFCAIMLSTGVSSYWKLHFLHHSVRLQILSIGSVGRVGYMHTLLFWWDYYCDYQWNAQCSRKSIKCLKWLRQHQHVH